MIWNTLSNLTPGFSGADLENVCNEAAINAAREKSKLVNKSHFDVSLEWIKFGLRDGNVLEGKIWN